MYNSLIYNLTKLKFAIDHLIHLKQNHPSLANNEFDQAVSF